MAVKSKTKSSKANLSKLKQILKDYDGKPGSLIPILQEAQAAYGYLPPEVLEGISSMTGIPLSRVFGVVTFYAQFYLEPRGKHTVRVCRGTACHVKGGKAVLDTAKGTLGVEEGQTTKNRKFTLETVACLGTCFLAPVMMIGNDYFGRLTVVKTQTVLKQYG